VLTGEGGGLPKNWNDGFPELAVPKKNMRVEVLPLLRKGNADDVILKHMCKEFEHKQIFLPFGLSKSITHRLKSLKIQKMLNP
jgi:hypothetical protein